MTEKKGSKLFLDLATGWNKDARGTQPEVDAVRRKPIRELGEQMGDVARRFPKADILDGWRGTDERHLGEIAVNVNKLRRVTAD